jgi:hypothetical protein
MSPRMLLLVLLASFALIAPVAWADVVTESNSHAAAIASTVKATPIAVRTMAIVQVSVYDALRTLPKGASADAAVAAATRTALAALVPAEKAAIDARYEAAVASLAAGQAKDQGIAAGDRAATAVLAERSGDGADTPPAYRPRTAPGVYVPTIVPVWSNWGARKPWHMKSGDAYRPGPPPALDSDIWKRDLAEIKAMGARTNSTRTEAQTAVARFWETTAPTVYSPVVHSVATAGKRDALDNARLFAEAATAMDDALIAVFDAKYAYEFWRPITAIRNAPDGVRDEAWEPLVDTPMHPEYPCAHCIVSGAVAAVLEAEIGKGPSPVLRTSSPTAIAGERTWATPAEFANEVSEGRICDGVHYRNSTEVGQAMGRKIGALAVERAAARK